ncbi:MAG: adenosine deaminase [Alphaproteobacteria bacterium]
MTRAEFIQALPKAELHLHLEGSFEPEQMFEIAQRNNVQIPFASVEEVKAAYEFSNLQDFLDIYYAGANVLLTEQDFHDLTWAYLTRVHADNVIHVEVFFDPQTHTDRGVAFDTVINGIWSALTRGESELGISFRLIMCFLRHLSEDEAEKTLDEALRHKDKIIGVGLDSSEVGHPPSKFERVFKRAGDEGFRLTAHAGEEGPPDYVVEALDLLKVQRIDHGNRSMEDQALVQRLADLGMCLTVCPLSNVRLRNCDRIEDHPLKKMMDAGLNVTVNSDDPAYFGGYMVDNFTAVADALDLSEHDLVALSRNAFESAWVDEDRRAEMLKQLEGFAPAF